MRRSSLEAVAIADDAGFFELGGDVLGGGVRGNLDEGLSAGAEGGGDEVVRAADGEEDEQKKDREELQDEEGLRQGLILGREGI